MKQIKKAYVEITNMCNRSCAFCPGTTREKAFMTEESFGLILRLLAGHVRSLYFHLMGEPLLHPLLGRFFDLAGEAGLPVNLTTNGTLLHRTAGMLLGKPTLRQVNVSLHGLPCDDMGAQVLEQAIAFARQASAQGRPIVAFRLWNEQRGEGNEENRWILDRLGEEYGLADLSLDAVTDGRGLMLAGGVYLNLAGQFNWPGADQEEVGGRGFCMGLRDQIGVLVDGTVVPCCLDAEGAIPLGNLLEQTLEEILNSDRAKALREGFSQRAVVEQLCRRCGYRKRFG